MPALSPERAAELGRRGGRSTQANRTPDERAAAMRKARLAQAAKAVAEHWPELTEAQQQRLRALLRPVPEGGGRDA